MIFKITKPFDLDKIKLLSESDKVRYLELLCNIKEGFRIPSKKVLENSDEELLKSLALCGIIQKAVIEENYWENGIHFLTISDFKKLNHEYEEGVIKEYIRKFDNWDDKDKKNRPNIFGSIRRWMKRDNLDVSEEQRVFMKKSFDAYVTNTGVEGSSKLVYNNLVRSYYKKGYSIKELREYWKQAILKEMQKSDDPKYRRRCENAMKDFEEWMKLKR